MDIRPTPVMGWNADVRNRAYLIQYEVMHELERDLGMVEIGIIFRRGE